MESLQKIYEQISKINWFCNCGNEINTSININCEYSKNWKLASANCKSSKWENVQTETRNIMTSLLDRDWSDKFQMWNNIGAQAKQLCKTGVTPKIEEYINNKSLDVIVLHSIEWDIITAMMEYAYSPYVKSGFYTELLKVYENGNFPCGWKGKWPDGNLLIY